MADIRRTEMSEEELDVLADKITKRMQYHESCQLTDEQQRAVIALITTKKRVVRITLYAIGALVLWALKDIYLFITSHLAWGGR